MTNYWRGKRVMVTGASGLLGQSLVDELEQKDPFQLILPGSEHYDLTDQLSVQDLFNSHKPDILIHAAAKCAGIKTNIEEPYEMAYENAMMTLNVIEEARRAEVKKLIIIGTVCSYPDLGPRAEPIKFHEGHLHLGKPEKTVEAYGLSKRFGIDLAMFLARKGSPIVLCPILANLYGENDHFESENCHVIPALIKRLSAAKENEEKEVLLMGTGQAYREFLYAPEAAQLIVKAAEEITESLVFNLGSGEVTNIYSLAHLISDLLGYKGSIKFSGEGPNGISYRCLSSSEANSRGVKASTSLRTGLKKTIDHYLSSQAHKDCSGINPVLLGSK